MYIRLVTDYSLFGRGFRLFWDATATGSFSLRSTYIKASHTYTTNENKNIILKAAEAF